MILHASVTADEPKAAAETLARLIGGVALPVGPGEGSWTAAGPDPIGNLVSFLERGSEFHRRPDDHVETMRGAPTRHSGFHLLVETALSERQVLELARKRGCHAHRATHGAYDVIEFWIDDCQLIEIVTPELGRRYREGLASAELRQRLEPIVRTGLAETAADIAS